LSLWGGGGGGSRWEMAAYQLGFERGGSEGSAKLDIVAREKNLAIPS
jgi:hypothetical protein